MTGQLSPADDATLREVYDLADALLSREISAADSARLARLVSEDAEARRHYIRFMHDSALLGEWGREASGVARAASTPPDDDLNPQPIVLDLSSPSDASTPFVGGFVFSYMVATVFVCLLLLGFWAYKLPSDRGSSIASNENSRGLTDPGESSPDRPVPVFVGRVTGIAGAKWSDEPNYIAPMGFRVALGRT
ncbi:MAG: hypothetical protein GX594_15180, partial [Pirellulaceae bacterium]|nr:hypothetical protein [Pirellulaceae bacterium]